jgi:predicted lactoylglutathione lyase
MPSGGRASRPATEATASPVRGRVYSDTYYGGFLLDPDGNNVEAVNHNREEASP